MDKEFVVEDSVDLSNKYVAEGVDRFKRNTNLHIGPGKYRIFDVGTQICQYPTGERRRLINVNAEYPDGKLRQIPFTKKL